MSIGVPELLIVLAIVLVLVGGKRLPGLGRGLGTGMREFKDSITGRNRGEDEDEARLSAGSAGGEEEPLSGEVVADRRG